MPGREENIQKNISRVASKIASPLPQESEGKSPGVSTGGVPRSFFGGNYDVYSALDSIEFQGALGDASMRGNIAYIRVWKRGGTAAQTSSGAQAQTQDPGANDALSILGKDVDARFGPERENLPDDSVIIYNNDTLSYTVESGDIKRDIEGSAQTFFVSPPNSERQKAIGTQTPTSSVTPPVGINAASAARQTLSSTNKGGIGAVISANPSGFTNILSKVARSALGLSLTKPPYTGSANAPKSGKSSAASGEMMWQFLFNPSELELEVGPEFKGAETWGVSDKANSGQPLHWSHNKNAQLKFNSVLLNGFVFGRKVEALEQGLLELFMSRDGEGQHGPHVLEFVWGKRVFGPCVMKNINIKEKMWDEGEVVNAELSFTLEQVPEWTINDGAYVDVARPGRQPLVADAAQPSSASTTTTTPPATTTTTTPPGAGEKADQKSRTANNPPPSNNFYPQNECDAGRRVKANFERIARDFPTGLGGFLFGVGDNAASIAVSDFGKIYDSFATVLNTLPLDRNCKAKCIYRGVEANNNRDLSCARDCSKQAASLLNTRYNKGKCLTQTVLPTSR
jgi:hypothetical protein